MGVLNSQKIDVNIVGSSVFGRYPKISSERTFNMFISDDWLVTYPGFSKLFNFSNTLQGKGRGLFKSTRGNFVIAVIESLVYKVTDTLGPQIVGTLSTSFGDVFIDENLAQQICIVDGELAYIYNSSDNSLTPQTFTNLPFTPSYVTYHNTFFLLTGAITDLNPQNWYVCSRLDDHNISKVGSALTIQTKPDAALAVVRIPGHSNNVIVFGGTVSELWNQSGGIQNYTKITSVNIDSGVLSTATIATNEEFIAWLGVNEKNAPSIMITNGSETKRISTDGIDPLLVSLKHPENSTAVMFKLDGHLFYHLTFYDPLDNLTLFYDFNTSKFFDATDENLNYHPMHSIVNYLGKLYFISINDNGFYEMSTNFINYNYNSRQAKEDEIILIRDIPRKRITNTLRLKDGGRFRADLLTFILEQGVTDFPFVFEDTQVCVLALITEDGNSIISETGDTMLSEEGWCQLNAGRPRIDFSMSKNGGQNFGNNVGHYLNSQGNYRNQLRFWGLGIANELTFQFDFWGMQRFVCNNGTVDIVNDNP